MVGRCQERKEEGSSCGIKEEHEGPGRDGTSVY